MKMTVKIICKRTGLKNEDKGLALTAIKYSKKVVIKNQGCTATETEKQIYVTKQKMGKYIHSSKAMKGGSPKIVGKEHTVFNKQYQDNFPQIQRHQIYMHINDKNTNSLQME